MVTKREAMLYLNSNGLCWLAKKINIRFICFCYIIIKFKDYYWLINFSSLLLDSWLPDLVCKKTSLFETAFTGNCRILENSAIKV